MIAQPGPPPVRPKPESAAPAVTGRTLPPDAVPPADKEGLEYDDTMRPGDGPPPMGAPAPASVDVTEEYPGVRVPDAMVPAQESMTAEAIVQDPAAAVSRPIPSDLGDAGETPEDLVVLTDSGSSPYGMAAAVVLLMGALALAWNVLSVDEPTVSDTIPAPAAQPRVTPPEPSVPPPAPEAGADDSSPAIDKALAELEAGDTDTAPAADDAASDHDAQIESAERAYKKGAVSEARDIIDGILADDPENARALVLRATLLIDGGALDEALVAAKAAAASDPDMADAHLAMGVILQERKDDAAALAAYQRYLELAPDGLYADSIRRQVRRLGAATDSP